MVTGSENSNQLDENNQDDPTFLTQEDEDGEMEEDESGARIEEGGAFQLDIALDG